MVAGHGYGVIGLRFSTLFARNNRLVFFAVADREIGRVRRIDHCREILDPEHAEIGDRSAAPNSCGLNFFARARFAARLRLIPR